MKLVDELEKTAIGKVRICKRYYKIILEDLSKDTNSNFLFGQTNYVEGKIFLSFDMDKITRKETIYHEVFHAVLFEAGFSQVKLTKEVIADFLGVHIEDIIKISKSIEHMYN